MNYNFSGASKRHTNFPGTRAGCNGRMAGQQSSPAFLSPMELRRLVAEMVD